MSSQSWLRPLALAAALLLPFAAAMLVYARFLGQSFFRDDTAWLLAARNPDVLDFLRDAFTLPGGSTPYWRPLADFYFFAMYRLFFLNALPYHAANVVLHGATATATVLLIRQMTRSLLAGALAGTLFAVAPAYGEGVIWISTVGTSMAALFSVITMVLFLRYIDEEGGRGTLFLAIGTFTAALLSMEASVCVPAILVVLGLAVRPPQGAADIRRFVMALLPFVVLGAAYAALQLSQAYLEPTSEHQLDWHAAARLGDRVLWLSLPLASWDYGSWVDGARWVSLAMLTLAAAVAVLRRQWMLPALFASAIFALIPSSFLTGMFVYRLVYMASPLWAGFVAVLVTTIVRWLWMRHALAGGVTLLFVTSALAAALLPHSSWVQRGVTEQAAQMGEIRAAIEAGCSDLGSGDTVFILPLPIVDPPGQGLVPSLIHLVRPEPGVVHVGGSGLPPPSPGDCVLEWRSGKYRAVVGSDYVPNRFWGVTLTAPCPAAVPWQRAGFHNDELAIVRGPVVDVVHVGVTTILQIGGPSKHRFNVIPAPEHQMVFQNPETAYLGETICVRGVVRAVQGVLTMTIEDPDVIAIE